MTSYWGGKKKIGHELAQTMLEQLQHCYQTVGFTPSCYWEPFLGMAGVMQHVAVPIRHLFPGIRVRGTDLDLGVMRFWYALLHEEWEPPRTITFQEYRHLKETRKGPHG